MIMSIDDALKFIQIEMERPGRVIREQLLDAARTLAREVERSNAEVELLKDLLSKQAGTE